MTDSSARRNPTLSGLLGVRDRDIVWGRLFMFVLASIAANLVYLIVEAIRPGSLPPEFRLYFLLTNLLAPFLRGIAAFVGFRFIKNEVGAAAVAGLVYLPLIGLLRALLAPSFSLDFRIVYSWFWVFLELALLALAVRLFRSAWLGLAVASVAASLIAGWVQTGIEAAIRHASFSVGGLLGSAWIDLLGGVVFATVFWFGLRLAWCRPEALGLEGPVPSPEASGGAAGLEDAGLLRVLEFRALAKHLRSSGIGSLIFGLLAIGLGASSRGANSINSVLIVLGIVLVAEGIWVLAAPAPAGLIMDGIVLILLGLWNIVITGINAGRGAGGSAGPFGLIGIVQIGWGIQSFIQYRRYARLTGPKPAAEEMKAAEARLQSLAQGAAPGAPDVIGFRPVGTAKAMAWTARLLPGALLLIFANKAAGYSPKATTVLTPDASVAADGTRKARLRLSDRTLRIRIGEDAIARFNAWKAGA